MRLKTVFHPLNKQSRTGLNWAPFETAIGLGIIWMFLLISLQESLLIQSVFTRECNCSLGHIFIPVRNTPLPACLKWQKLSSKNIKPNSKGHADYTGKYGYCQHTESRKKNNCGRKHERAMDCLFQSSIMLRQAPAHLSFSSFHALLRYFMGKTEIAEIATALQLPLEHLPRHYFWKRSRCGRVASLIEEDSSPGT